MNVSKSVSISHFSVSNHCIVRCHCVYLTFGLVFTNQRHLVKILKILFPIFFKEWGTTYFTFEEDPEPFGRVRDQNIVAMCKEMNIAVSHEHSHTLYNLEKYEFLDEAETRRYVMY